MLGFIIKWFKAVLAFSLLAGAATSALATSDITNRDVQALRGLKAVVLLDPELDDVAKAAGVTPALIAKRVAVYLRDVGVKVITDADLRPGDRAQTASLLLQSGAIYPPQGSPQGRGTATFITINVLREKPGDAEAVNHPVYIVQERGQARGKVTRNFLMRELDLALNMLREDLRRARR